MSRYVLDTNHAGTLLRDQNAPLWAHLSPLRRDECVLCQPVVAEPWFMVQNSSRPEANAGRLQALLAQFDVLEFDAPAAVEYGVLRTELRRKGRPLPTFDVLIAAIARLHGFTLLTSDGHFGHVDGLKVESWL